MKDMIERVTDSVKDVTAKSSKAIKEAIGHDDTKAALEWTKSMTSSLADEAAKLGKEVASSDLVKDAAAGAAIGAAISIPIPVIGPAAGAVVGAGLGVYKNLTTRGSQSQNNQRQPSLPTNTIDVHAELLKFDELRQKGIISESEFQERKARLLK